MQNSRYGAQSGIVMFLEGQTYASNMMASLLDAKRFEDFDPKKVSDTFQENTLKEMSRNGLPDRCLECSKFQRRLDSQDAPVEYPGGVSFRVRVRCEQGGCNEARIDYVANHNELKHAGRDTIDLEVSVEPGEFKEFRTVSGSTVRACTESERIRLTPRIPGEPKRMVHSDFMSHVSTGASSRPSLRGLKPKSAELADLLGDSSFLRGKWEADRSYENPWSEELIRKAREDLAHVASTAGGGASALGRRSASDFFTTGEVKSYNNTVRGESSKPKKTDKPLTQFESDWV